MLRNLAYIIGALVAFGLLFAALEAYVTLFGVTLFGVALPS